MKVLLFGHGNIGRRHKVSIEVLRPEAEIIIADPLAGDMRFWKRIWTANPGEATFEDAGHEKYVDWREALAVHADADAAVIASPTGVHLEQAQALADKDIPTLCEKPPWDVGQAWGPNDDPPIVFAFCYRFHPVVQAMAGEWIENGHVAFEAQDNLVPKYGRTCPGTMGSHSIDVANFLFGPAHYTNLISDGTNLIGDTLHRCGSVSYHLVMDKGPRESFVKSGGNLFALRANDGMYTEEMAVFLKYAETGYRDARLASFQDGLNVMRVLEAVK